MNICYFNANENHCQLHLRRFFDLNQVGVGKSCVFN